VCPCPMHTRAGGVASHLNVMIRGVPHRDIINPHPIDFLKRYHVWPPARRKRHVLAGPPFQRIRRKDLSSPRDPEILKADPVSAGDFPAEGCVAVGVGDETTQRCVWVSRLGQNREASVDVERHVGGTDPARIHAHGSKQSCSPPSVCGFLVFVQT